MFKNVYTKAARKHRFQHHPPPNIKMYFLTSILILSPLPHTCSMIKVIRCWVSPQKFAHSFPTLARDFPNVPTACFVFSRSWVPVSARRAEGCWWFFSLPSIKCRVFSPVNYCKPFFYLTVSS
jgi:hypothetical protein